jgi:hypothetical protein
MEHTFVAPLIGVGLFLGILALLELGRRIGIRSGAQEDGARAGIGAVEGAAFGLMGLLIAFTFSGAASRFEARRELIVQEANAIGTVWLRLDLLSEGAQPALRDGFRRYLDSRLATYAKLPDVAAARAELKRSEQLQREIWSASVPACREAGPPACALLLPALNDMIDITTARTMAAENHPPTIIFALLIVLALVCSLLAGYAMTGPIRRPLHMAGFAAITALSVYVILDLEYPRIGWIRIDSTDRVLRELRASMD